jgi:hypothetical protein
MNMKTSLFIFTAMKRQRDDELVQASMIPPFAFDDTKEIVGVDIGSSNFAATLEVGKLGEVTEAIYVSLKEHGPADMNLYTFAPAVSAMVDSYPNIFKRGRYLIVENQISGQEHADRVKNPNMPIIAGALIAYCCSSAIGMIYLPVYPVQMYSQYYGRSRGTNDENKIMTLKYVPAVLTSSEKAIIRRAYDRKVKAAKERCDVGASSQHHILDAAVMGWYGADQHTGRNTYDRREDKEESTSYESD